MDQDSSYNLAGPHQGCREFAELSLGSGPEVLSSLLHESSNTATCFFTASKGETLLTRQRSQSYASVTFIETEVKEFTSKLVGGAISCFCA